MEKLSKLLRDIIPVMLGILIALVINNWNETRKEKKYLQKINASIKSELQESVEDIKRVLPVQLASVDTIEAYLDNDELSMYDLLFKIDGIYSPSIKTNSWNALANSRIELIEYEKLTLLANIEEWKENLANRIEKQTDFVFYNMEETDRVKKKIYRMIILDIIGSEQRLQSSIEELLESEFASTD